MKNDKTIAVALGKAAQQFDSNAELGRKAGVHGATIGQYRNGRISYISDEVWEKLYPLLQPYLPDDPRYYPRSALKSMQMAETAGYYGTPPKELQRLCKAWEQLCEVEKAKILGYVEGILDASKNLDHAALDDCPHHNAA